jgi:hypothetical protein
MTDLDWDSKTVIGKRSAVAKVTKKESDLNGVCYTHFSRNE